MTSLTRTPARNHAEIVQSVVASSSALGRAGFAASWRRSLIHHKIDPGTPQPSERLSESEMRARREASGLLVQIATPVLDRLARAACDAGCTVLLSDASGLVLDERVRAGDARDFHASDLAPGTNWSEGAQGTNGIGTCLAEGRPVVVWRDQHFRATNTGLTCMGAPVFGATGELAGVIDVSSARGDMTEGYARLVALTVQDAAQRIEADLFRASYDGARILSTGAGESAPQGVMLLALDRDDLVIGATRAARRHLGIEDAQIGRLPANDLLELGLRGGLEEAQRAEMARALARSGGNVSAAARDLGIGRATFYRKAKALGLEV
ncbi:GAF domain-containing protein [Paenirhodobacter sp. CAU 1674]|uniref:GAF domain-containing protein n=1 Tax=Paenirhodobacter sp. CAU 1674 TaxID=3032596 RepID=UPI0023DAF683|nr:GAF domain-containing protein [Paenirhodobacter sp. CAU 1674]MDF2142798.1 GAF domain-containing protein [Paenirhodobacter sp. CAU 1674]